MSTELIRDAMPGDPMYEALPELYSKAGERAVELIPGPRLRLRTGVAGLEVLSLLESGWLGQDAVIASR